MTTPLFSNPTNASNAPEAVNDADAVNDPDAENDAQSSDASQPAQPDAPSKLDELIAVTARLRAPGGCPWDAEQTHESLVKYLVEETHELVDAIESGTREDLLEELGDVLYQVVFHADLAAQTPGEEFDIQDVAAHMTVKMVGRHPHVFGDTVAETADAVVAIWDDLKAVEKPGRTSVLDGIPLGMPSLALADKLLGKAHKIGVLDEAAPPIIPMSTEDELGPLLLAIVASAKSQGLDAERALRSTLRGLQDEIREAESDARTSAAPNDRFDAGIVGLPASD
ncbi:MazG family protein [Subtercola frigoramans]|uniref:XTP/dITP diphosphohydrolase n=1 Tax=Subtercola frigoramans TaxID=120298 RepID=A0ABS2L3Z5_9MICO|nr:MazG family protein [Subtercola frigoramans]MBM7471621.1 XTP/dITP diphosphohydrolase [Subtercola frigoramans]